MEIFNDNLSNFEFSMYGREIEVNIFKEKIGKNKLPYCKEIITIFN
jgi:hypothetical protein